MKEERFRLTKSLLAVQFNIDQQTRGFLALPVGTDVRVLGPSEIPACVEINCKDENYQVFRRDLLSNSTLLMVAMAARP
jgi:hypothetical protein